MNPYLILAAVAAMLSAYFYGRHDGEAIIESKYLAVAIASRDAKDLAMEKAAQEIAKITVVNKTIQGKVETIVHEKTVYTTCAHDVVGLSLVNAALTNSPVPPGDSKLPDADAPKRFEFRSDNAKVGGGVGGLLPLSGSSTH